MKFLVVIIFSIILYSNSSNIYSYDLTYTNYFPLQIGNVWIYKCTAIGMACDCIKKYKFKITSSVSLNGKIYFIFQKNGININCPWNYCDGPTIYYDTLRIDSSSGNIYKYSTIGCSNSPNEILHDSLKANLNDTIRNYCGVSQYRYICLDTNPRNILGFTSRFKSFSESQFETGYGRAYAYGFGLTVSGYGSIRCSQNSELIGCVINGVIYGDTSMIVGIIPISTEIPDKFELQQNYPNPFNPSTKIKFDNPPSPLSERGDRGGFVKLIVYDAIGREVQTLVNEQLQPGSYEVEWNAADFPSGVYYYKLETESFTQTKKMLLIK